MEEIENEEEGCFDVGGNGNKDASSAIETQNPTGIVEDAMSCVKRMHNEDTKCPSPKLW